MEKQNLSERQQNAVERLQEDEGLTGDLTDTPARALITGATTRASTIAGDTTLSDEQVDVSLRALRRAILVAASSGEEDPDQLIASVSAAVAPPAATTGDGEHSPPQSDPVAAEPETQHAAPATQHAALETQHSEPTPPPAELPETVLVATEPELKTQNSALSTQNSPPSPQGGGKRNRSRRNSRRRRKR